ncbi:MAG TPA: DivIVA domain-containing protein [Solirubrobacteraceae bacterium]|jgi:DivIVA domain-containing protein|nr:DivIVA domain-containing protein [Solirubrobacteraceae bacterium]
MALDRQSIEKRDFPIGRRGYDPAAVDAHLTEIASQVEELRVTARRHSESLASSASEQVRAIVEAAEASATEILRQAETEAREIRAEAAQEAQAARTDATTQARDYVGRVSESTTVMLQRLNAMESELSSLIDGLRTGSNRLNADLQLLEGNFDGVRDAVGPRAQFATEAEPSTAGPLASSVEEPEPATEVVAAVAETVAVEAGEQPEPEPEAADLEGARLVALNMALNGTPREETNRYLAENFDLDDRQLLLDEVYASVAD